ncbi:hypothetical protein JTE90_012738 [Oedothorax gibbosus]|uniref:Uncharacterized protein n=1 Tax=Oedothorax gibbosus TaxID=931172 RepID=A0AAV6VXC9_9ARAC|nr:hypothetical protein JTE90_012738 [Oedothorax gibbosus]
MDRRLLDKPTCTLKYERLLTQWIGEISSAPIVGRISRRNATCSDISVYIREKSPFGAGFARNLFGNPAI